MIQQQQHCWHGMAAQGFRRVGDRLHLREDDLKLWRVSRKQKARVGKYMWIGFAWWRPSRLRLSLPSS